MSRRVSLPTADDLFRPTVVPAVEEAVEPAASRSGADAAADAGAADTAPHTPSGRVRHDEKMTVYVTADELLDLEQARITLRRSHGLAVDRGRLVRQAIAIALADLEANGDDSVIVQRLTADMTAGLTVDDLAVDEVAAPFAVRLDNFEGPFDLLLSLIAKHKLDITEVALSKVTDEFIALHQARRRRAGTSSRRRRSCWSPPRCSTSRRRGCCRRATSRTRRTWRCSRRATCSSPGCCSTAPTSRSPA